ncbi:MAG: hypothetical protein HHJ12_13445 [Glaciimonas sp.]|nr:hypothetical protein [Glaciimonas sp.]
MNQIYRILCTPTAAALASAALVLTLSACGGGGASAPAPVTPTPTPANYSALLSSVAPASYAGEQASVLVRTNAIRLGAGAGLLAQSAALDTAASKHAAFLVNNRLASNSAYLDALHEGVLGGHYEDPTLPGVLGFSGKTPQARATAAAYAGTVSELVLLGAASGAECMASIENSVYHLARLFSPVVQVGLAFNAGNGSGSVCVMELGVSGNTAGQLPGAGSVVTYPYAGQSAVLPTFYNRAETPTPVADLALAGHPVLVSLYSLAAPSLQGSDIVIQRFALSRADGQPVSARLLAQAGVTSSGPTLGIDANLAGAGTLFLVPGAPLAANTTYRVTFAATLKGQAVARDWSFTTGAAN